MTKPCGVEYSVPPGDAYTQPCLRPRARTKQKCRWHWLMGQPIEVQVRAASARREQPHFDQVRKTVPEREWPVGERWCSGCQSFIPLFYVQGSRCKACSSQAAHASHVQRTYDLSPEEYQALLDWQGGRCYVCRKTPRVRRLAVDHDHRTGLVRGLLCSNDEWGCNVLLAQVLNDADSARRLVEYVERSPLDRMRAGEPPQAVTRPRSAIMDSLRASQPGVPRCNFDGHIMTGRDSCECGEAQRRAAQPLDRPDWVR